MTKSNIFLQDTGNAIYIFFMPCLCQRDNSFHGISISLYSISSQNSNVPFYMEYATYAYDNRSGCYLFGSGGHSPALFSWGLFVKSINLLHHC